MPKKPVNPGRGLALGHNPEHTCGCCCGLEWPVPDEDGIVRNINFATASFVIAWAVQGVRTQQADPVYAATIRGLFGLDPNTPIFNPDGLLCRGGDDE